MTRAFAQEAKGERPRSEPSRPRRSPLRRALRGVVLGALLSALCFPTPGAADDTAQALFTAGLEAFNAGHLEEARQKFDAARKLTPQWAMTQLYWAMLETRLDPSSAAAVAALERAVQGLPTNPRAHYYLGVAYLRAGRFAEAEGALREAARLRPGLEDTSFQLAVALEEQQKVPEATAAFETVLTETPNHTGALVALAKLYETQGQLGKAEGALMAIAQQQPEVAFHHIRLAEFYERTGQTRKAAASRRRANAVAPLPKRQMRPLRQSRR